MAGGGAGWLGIFVWAPAVMIGVAAAIHAGVAAGVEMVEKRRAARLRPRGIVFRVIEGGAAGGQAAAGLRVKPAGRRVG